MHNTTRHRRRRYQNAYGSQQAAMLRYIPMVIAILLVLIGGYYLVQWWGDSASAKRQPALLSISERGVVQVSLNGDQLRRANDGASLYAGDRIVTGPSAHAALALFDGSTLRVDQDSDLTITESTQNSEGSTLTLTLDNGKMWIATPSLRSFTGSIVRTIRTPRMTYNVPARSEALVSLDELNVFAAHGAGIEVSSVQTENSIHVGEGQRFFIATAGTLNEDLYQYRSPISLEILELPFLIESREEFVNSIPEGTLHGSQSSGPQETLLIDSPEDGTLIAANTVEVRGSVSSNVSLVHINGYPALIDRVSKTFTQELSMPEVGELEIRIEALDSNSVVLDEKIRTVKRHGGKLDTPTIVNPSNDGTFTTTSTEIQITGTAPENAVNIVVNGYTLQLFKEGSEEWGYIANTEIGNLQYGENTYSVVAIDEAGNESEPATITITLKEAEEASSSSTDQEQSSSIDVSNLPDNDPLSPGTLSITSPTNGDPVTMSEPKVAIEGQTSADTQTVWVNGYQLQQYKPGSSTWRFIASSEFRTMKRGENIYEVVSRNAAGEILDRIEYVITLDLRR